MFPFLSLTEGDSKQGINVVCLIRGTKHLDEYIVIGAHHDHLGMAPSGDTTVVFYGADDNASGVAMLIESARFLAQQKPERNIIFVTFSAEEKGLFGSDYFAVSQSQSNDHASACIL